MKKIILLLLTIVLVSGFVSSQVYQINKEIDLKIPFEVNGSSASDSAICNVSIQYPNSSYLKDEETATNLGNGEFNITLTSDEISDLGIYSWVAFCCDGTSCAGGYGSFEVTQTGSVLSTAQGIIYIVFLIVILVIFTFSLAGAIKIPFNNHRDSSGKIISVNDLKYVKIFLMVISYILLLFIFGITKSIMENFLFLDNASKVFSWLYWIMWSFMWPIIVLSLLLTLVYFLQGLKIKTSLERGVPLR